jgi:hypothetical protein
MQRIGVPRIARERVAPEPLGLEGALFLQRLPTEPKNFVNYCRSAVAALRKLRQLFHGSKFV